MICRWTESNDILLELVAKTWRSALTRCRSSMKTARSMSWRFKKGLALVSPAWMRAVRRRKLCERRCSGIARTSVGCSRTEIRLTPCEMRTQFVRHRRRDRHVAISASFCVDDVNLWWIAVQK